ncbi:class A beta-lactamase [Sphingobacterium endophyticum]|uniref:class A beta-lactamase n=1 Tax=Sphingobacterium endophyticum TaxID=2546448 RepID=UPI0012E10940|nr:class A beta-lactamase [Sphingobacterium endophyticum]
MIQKLSSLTLLILLACQISFGQDKANLESKINAILSNYDAKVGVAINNNDFSESILINSEHPFPLQSTYKFHLGIVILDQVDQGKLTLDQPISISKKSVTTDMYSPIKDKYPNGTTLPLHEVLRYTIAESDNVGCDILFELLGGPDFVQKYFDDQGYQDLSIKLIEEIQQANWDLQFDNWTKVKTSNKILFDYYKNSKQQLSEASYKFLWDTMRSTSTGRNRIKGLLPQGTVVAHKTGYSGVNKTTQVIAAVNDIGVVSLPNGEVFYISVYVTDSKETEPRSAEIIAKVSKAAYDYFVVNSNKKK